MNPNDLAEAELEPERYELYAEPRYRFAPDRRDFLKTLGAGIVVGLLVEVEQSEAQPPAGRGRGRGRGFGGGAMPQDLGAWLHIDEKGTVTVSTGKVEVGQNVRTLFTQVVAEELRLPVSAVRLVMADTDRVPFDTGTFGSGSTPRMAPQLARVAAAARELLLDLAAEQLQAARGTLVFEGGQVTNPATKTALTFSELTRGQKLTKTVAADQNVTPVDQWKVQTIPPPKLSRHEHRQNSQRVRPGHAL